MQPSKLTHSGITYLRQQNPDTPESPLSTALFHSSVDHSLDHSPADLFSPANMRDYLPSDLPAVGQTRCYWAILSTELDFVYVDPVLSAHLEGQAAAIIGTSLLDFVHPDEQETAREDLGRVIDQRGLHGSVTRVRFCRVSAVRTKLGLKSTTPPGSLYTSTFPAARKSAIDDNYMPCEVVLNWAADNPSSKKFGAGILLCFLHAAIDLNPVADNDERYKTTWSNWCGTPHFRDSDVKSIYGRLLGNTPISVYQHSSTFPSRVFQIIENGPDRHVLFSWPPASYTQDLDKLARGVHIEPNIGGRTGCQRRFQAEEVVDGRPVESIFIPHGSIIFACHTFSDYPSNGAPIQSSIQTYAVPGSLQSQYYDLRFGYSSENAWTPGSHSSHSQSTNSSPLDTKDPNRSAWQSDMRTPSPDSAASKTSYRPWNVEDSQAHILNATTTASRDGGDIADAHHNQRQKRSDSSGGRQFSHSTTSSRAAPSSSSASKAVGLPPAGIIRCASCKTTASPEWRKGSSGKKELCNACGLRYSRSRAKKEGREPQKRRRDEKNPSPFYSGLPRSSSPPLRGVHPAMNKGLPSSPVTASPPPGDPDYTPFRASRLYEDVPVQRYSPDNDDRSNSQTPPFSSYDQVYEPVQAYDDHLSYGRNQFDSGNAASDYQGFRHPSQPAFLPHIDTLSSGQNMVLSPGSGLGMPYSVSERPIGTVNANAYHSPPSGLGAPSSFERGMHIGGRGVPLMHLPFNRGIRHGKEAS